MSTAPANLPISPSTVSASKPVKSAPEPVSGGDKPSESFSEVMNKQEAKSETHQQTESKDRGDQSPQNGKDLPPETAEPSKEADAPTSRPLSEGESMAEGVDGDVNENQPFSLEMLELLGLQGEAQNDDGQALLKEQAGDELDGLMQQAAEDAQAVLEPINPILLAPVMNPGLEAQQVEGDLDLTDMLSRSNSSLNRLSGRETVGLSMGMNAGGGFEESLDDLMQRGFGAFAKGQGGTGLLTQAANGSSEFQSLLGQTAERAVSAATQLNSTASTTGVPVQAKPLDIPVGARGWDQGVGERVQWMLGRGVQSAELRLNPQNLGPMEIKVSVQNDQTQITFLAHHAVTKEALEAGLPRLREMLGESNLNLVNVDVGQKDSAAQQSQGDGAESSDSGVGNGLAGDDDAVGEDEQTAQVRTIAQGLVDDFA